MACFGVTGIDVYSICIFWYFIFVHFCFVFKCCIINGERSIGWDIFFFQESNFGHVCILRFSELSF